MNLILGGGRIIDGLGGELKCGTLVIEGQAITEVIEGKDYPPKDGFGRIDCRGKTVMPGLIDVHVHVGGGDVVPGLDDFRASRRLDEPLVMHAFRSLEAAQRALRAGFTTLRDMSARDFVDVHLRNAAQENLVVAPRLICSGPGITMTGGHVWQKCIQVDGPQEIRKEIRRQIREGADWIKIMGVTGGTASGQDIRRTQFTQEEITTAVEETHRLGRRCAAHVHGLQGIALCIEAGMDTVEHGTFLDEGQAEKMCARGIYLVPTLLVSFARRQGTDDPALKKKDEGLQRMGIRIPEPEERMALARKCGVKVLAGSDCGGSTRAIFGHQGMELYWLTRCGFTNLEAIVSATGLAAEAMGLADTAGSIRPGRMADLLIVDGNPLEDVTVLTLQNSRIQTVIKDGKIVCRDLVS